MCLAMSASFNSHLQIPNWKPRKPARQTTESLKHAANLFCSKMFPSGWAAGTTVTTGFLKCSCSINSPSDLWKLQQLQCFHVILLSKNSATDRSLRTTENTRKNHANAVFYAFLLRITSANDHWELQYFHVFSRSCSALILPAIFENYSHYYRNFREPKFLQGAFFYLDFCRGALYICRSFFPDA